MDADPSMSFATKTFKEPFAPTGGAQAGFYHSNGDITFKSDGTVLYFIYVSGPLNWYEPPSSGIGSSYWIRLHRTGGHPLVSNDNVWLSLATNPVYQSNGVGGNSNGTLDIATDSGGSSIVASGSYQIDD